MVAVNSSYDFLARTASLWFLLSFLFLFSFFFRRLISEVTERISTKLGHIFTYGCYLKNFVQTPRRHLCTARWARGNASRGSVSGRGYLLKCASGETYRHTCRQTNTLMAIIRPSRGRSNDIMGV